MRALIRRRTGFTMIELLMVVLVLAILASLAMTKFGESKRRAYITAMRSDLRGLATVAESRYTTDNSYENVEAPQGSQGVTLTFVGTTSGWSALAKHVGVPAVACTMASGSSLAADTPAEPVCTP